MSQSTPTPDTTARTETAETVTVPVELRMDAYWYGFIPTGVVEIDTILSAVACAGKAYHSTSEWTDEAHTRAPHVGRTPVEWIQNAANKAAAALASPQHPVGVREALDYEAEAKFAWNLQADEDNRWFDLSDEEQESLQKVVAFAIGRGRSLATLSHPPAQDAPGAVTKRLRSQDVEWVTNDIAELGVKVGDQFFFLYKGRSLVYGELDTDPTKPPVHDDGSPMHWRHVFKREFGECAHPLNTKDPTMIGTVSLDDSDEWKPLPAALDPSPPLPEAYGEVVAYRWRYEDQPDNWSYSRQKPRLASLPNVVCEPLVRQSALVSALRERDREARAKQHAIARSQEWLSYARNLVKRAEKAEQVADGLRVKVSRFLDRGDDRSAVACHYCGDTHGGNPCRSGGPHDFNETGETLWEFEGKDVEELRAALRASTEEGKTATPSVMEEEAGRG